MDSRAPDNSMGDQLIAWRMNASPARFSLHPGDAGDWTTGPLTFAVKVDGRWHRATEADRVDVLSGPHATELRCSGLAGLRTLSLVVGAEPGNAESRVVRSRAVSLSASATAAQPVMLGGFRLLEPLADAAWALPGGRTGWVLYGDGWRSNAVGSLLPLSDQSLDRYGSSDVKACWVTSVQNPARRQGFIAMAQSAETWPTWFEWTLGPGGLALAIRAGGGRDLEEVRLEPGRTRTTDGVLLTAYTNADPVRALDDFAACVARRRGPDTARGRDRCRARVSPRRTAPPMGWSSWSPYFRAVSEAKILSAARFMRDNLVELGYDTVLLDGGWWPHAGEFATNDAFPHGIRWLSDRVHELGLKFGLHMSPFRVADDSPFWGAHPDWRLEKLHDDRKPTLDASNPEVVGWLAAQYQRYSREWNVDLFKFDFLEWGAHEGRRTAPGLTGLEAYNRAVRAIRASVPDDVAILGCNGMTFGAVESFSALRLGPDINRHALPTSSPEYSPIEWGTPDRAVEDEYEWPIEEKRFFINITGTARSVARQYWVSSSLALPDADSPIVNPNLTLDEARAHVTLVALTGGVLLLGDVLETLPAERLALVTNEQLLSIRRRGRQALPVDLFAGEEIPRVWLLAADDEHESGRTDDDQPWQTVVGLFNWSDTPRDASLAPGDLGLNADLECSATDVWTSQRYRLGRFVQPVQQPPHSVLLLILDSYLEDS
jgi:hypothetical protein